MGYRLRADARMDTVVKAKQPIQRSHLARSIIDCHRIEDAQWQRMVALGCTACSSAADIRLALVTIRRECPSWCERDAWDRIADSFVTWASIFNSLQLFWRLRRKREE